MNAILTQTIYYGILMVITIFIISMLFRGFFWKFVKVRASMGGKVLVKIRTPLRDYYTVGWIEDNFLCYKKKKDEVKIPFDGSMNVFYRSIGVYWVDVDEEKGAICKVDYSVVNGHDLNKESDLLKRAMMRPSIKSNTEKILLILIIAVAIGVLACVYLSYTNYSSLAVVKAEMYNFMASAKGTVVGGTSRI